jgi:hypothetical protein
LNTILSTERENNNFDYREPTPPHEQINKITHIKLINNSTKKSFLQNHTKIIVDWSNQTHIVRKNLRKNKENDIYNRTLEEAAKYLTDRKLMQSLIHLIPPHLWAQIQNNRSIYHQNQTQYTKPLLPNPVLLAEAAAQAGLPSSGPYPVPEHLWYRYPPQIIAKPPTTCKFNRKKKTINFIINFYHLASTKRTTPPPTTTTPRPRPPQPISSVPSPVSNNNMYSLFSQIGFNCPPNSNGIRYPDRRLCNMYFTCTSTGLPEPNLCPEGYLFSDLTRDCELAGHVNCGARLSAFFELEENKIISPPTTTLQSKTNSHNNTIECILGADGYFEDSLYCNVYHHCIAGVDYIEPCPNQLAWNEKKKMCDWYVISFLFLLNSVFI